ncbi:hypothetical protein L202_01540 [Cryptococcus amylolentus CBS 6039]|uniref:Uncharacterized protein n=2 Tax=Cryptococcus amylolentus TaxID=104669 RepID=A0A1E3I6D5_9TREE|nr:hypothetical protein L202_01540 [Cryptococcus amylolentus CBS 6039]ODN83396.1 hypothetical protein L202_01540 [Cryptococcus amylolentus CBS 6039]ODO10925.1 hypothetical protein I350_01524 [Cryptococcus amylolentus CBS 6273]
MPYRTARTTTHHHHHGNHRDNRARGLRAAINNPRTTHAGRDNAQHELHAMGMRSTRPSLGTRIRHFLHLPGKSHNRRHTHRAHTTAPSTTTTTTSTHHRRTHRY